MVEVIDKDTAQKMMAMILGGIKYQDDYYLVYCVRRDKEEVNVFVSKMFKGNFGYIINDNFSNGEKEVLDNIVKKILNRESKESLEKAGFILFNDIDLDSNLEFNIEKCYVGAVSRNLIKNCLVFYGLVSEKIFEQPVVEVIEDKRKFNEGVASSIVLIIFGIVVLIFVCFVIFGMITG